MLALRKKDGGTISAGFIDTIGGLDEEENKLVRNLARRR